MRPYHQVAFFEVGILKEPKQIKQSKSIPDVSNFVFWFGERSGSRREINGYIIRITNGDEC